jgi:leucyl-tRNA synthetase
MVFINHAEKEGLTRLSYATYLKLLAPFAPHLTEELWSNLGQTTSIHLESTPTFNEALLNSDTVTIGVQINGKMRGTITISPDATEGEALARVQEDSALSAKLTTPPKKIIYVPRKILNLIVEE